MFQRIIAQLKETPTARPAAIAGRTALKATYAITAKPVNDRPAESIKTVRGFLRSEAGHKRRPVAESAVEKRETHSKRLIFRCPAMLS